MFFAWIARPPREAELVSQNKKGSYQIKLVPIGTSKQAKEALESVVATIVNTLWGSDVLTRKGQTSLERSI
jgi:hypothetical protein